MALLNDREWQSMYKRSDGDMVRMFYVPVLECAQHYDRTTGYFSASALALAARGIEGLLRNGGRMRLVVGCTLDKPELDAIERGEELRALVQQQLNKAPLEANDNETRNALELLAWMVAKGHLEVKVAIPADDNRKPIEGNAIFHAKSGIFEDKAGNRVAFNGSINETGNGWQNNFESFHVFCDWDGVKDKKHVDDEASGFARLWADKEPRALVVDIHTAVKQQLFVFLPKDDDLPVRLQNKPVSVVAAEKPKVPEPPVTPAIDPDEQRRVAWGIIQQAPSWPFGGERVGEATSAVEPWPHQVRAFNRLYDNWPPKLLIADEVGLGKTIEAGLFLRQAWMSGKAKRILILAPKSVLTQWQIELREKFNLNWPIYDGAKLKWLDTYTQRLTGKTEKVVSGKDWHKEPFVLASSQLMRRTDRAKALLEDAEPWDVVVLDEAHHARRKGAGGTKVGGANLLLQLMQGLRSRTQAMVLMTATPMQISPLEVWDLLSLLGMPEAWSSANFLQFFERVTLPSPSDADLDWLAGMFRSCGQSFGQPPQTTLDRLAKGSSPLRIKKIVKALNETANTPRRNLSTEERQTALTLMKATSPVAHLISRHTRELLRAYYKAGKISTRVAERNVQDTFVQMTEQERNVYEAVEAYIGSAYNAASAADKNAVGFVMTIYRRRVASSFAALGATLEKRLKQLNNASVPVLSEEDVSDDEIRDEEMDTAEAQTLDVAALKAEEVGEIQSLLAMVKRLPTDTKARDTLEVIEQLRAKGYQQVIIFTQYTDTLDFLRGTLVAAGLKVMCYSGRGGERLATDGTWKHLSRDDAKRAFKKGEADILVCTDAAAEGLNFQFCGALINYDMPWNPMRVEQRIGRIDRLGQKYEKIQIASMNYDGTVETDVYRALRARIGLFGTFVGKLQPILAKLPHSIAEFTLAPQRDKLQNVDELVENLKKDIAKAEQAGFDLDAITPDDLEQPERAPPAYGMKELDAVLRNSKLMPPGYIVKPKEHRSYALTIPGVKEPIRVTTSREFYEDQAESCELWSPGSPLFPVTGGAVPELLVRGKSLAAVLAEK